RLSGFYVYKLCIPVRAVLALWFWCRGRTASAATFSFPADQRRGPVDSALLCAGPSPRRLSLATGGDAGGDRGLQRGTLAGLSQSRELGRRSGAGGCRP